MKKMVALTAGMAVLLLTLSACGHTHRWEDATCTRGKVCTECGETEGEPLGHIWTEATCTRAKYCTRCEETEGAALEHTWTEATCTKPRTCSVCGKTEGTSLGHVVAEWTTAREPSCAEEGVKTGDCAVCGESLRKPIPKTDHIPGEWEVIEEPAKDTDGVRVVKCAVCGEELETETYSLTPEEIKANYIAKCVPYSYEAIARNPDAYFDTYGTYSGQIVQVMGSELIVDITSQDRYYSNIDLIYVLYFSDAGEPRLLEKDYITIYGTNLGLYSYDTVRGDKKTVPFVYAEYIDLW